MLRPVWYAVLLAGIVSAGLALTITRAPLAKAPIAKAPWRFWLAIWLLASPALVLLVPEPIPLAVPTRKPLGITVTSGACRSCHPGEYASWASSFHRTMTQVAQGGAILAPRGKQTLDLNGGYAAVEHSDDGLFIDMPDPELAAQVGSFDVPRLRARAVLTTGSHHYQAYWVPGSRKGELRAAPFVWHREAERWIPRHDVFLQPPDARDHLVRWNSNCLVCHATFAEPQHQLAEDAFETSVVELGIACEACHGAAGLHAEHYSDPLERLIAGEARHIVTPSQLPRERASEVCGQCHSYAIPRDTEAWWATGYARSYAPGADLSESRTLVTRELLTRSPNSTLAAASESLFWSDGTIRVGGREYNGLVSSRCFSEGQGDRKLSCMDCHQMHGADPDDQLRTEAKGNGACLSCHEGYERQSHTQHADPMLCYSCHMPKVSYALYRAKRSHRIDSPSATAAAISDRPPACNLCHLDKPLTWTQAELFARWRVPSDPFASENSVAFAVEAALRGDAAQRIIVAEHLLSPDAIRTVGTDFQLPLLAVLLHDPYAAIRYVAGRALTEAGYLHRGDYDFLGDREHRQQVIERLLQQWNEKPHADRPELLHPNGSLSIALLEQLLAERDDRPVTIAE